MRDSAKKVSESFCLPLELKRRLAKFRNKSQWLAALVARELGRCPVCNGKWPMVYRQPPPGTKREGLLSRLVKR